MLNKKTFPVLGILMLGCLLFFMSLNASAAGNTVDINTQTFPDTVFREYVSSHFDRNSDGKLSAEEIANVKTIEVQNISILEKKDPSIKSLAGVEVFTSLERLFCYGQEINTLDLSNNRELTGLVCSYNYLTRLDISGCTKLETLYCQKNKLKTLDLSNCKQIKYVECYDNEIGTIDVSGCEKLYYFSCGNNNMKNLNVSGCTGLQFLYCSKNQLKKIDVKDCPKLEYLWVYFNPMESIDISACKYIVKAYTEGAVSYGTRDYQGMISYSAKKNQYDFYSLSVDESQTVINPTADTQKDDNKSENGWKNKDGKWYYYVDGVLQKGWKKIKGKWYYLKKDGSMAAGEYCNGYWLNANGTWTYKPRAKWKKDRIGWYYIDTAGWYVRNRTVTIDGKKYSFNNKGYLE